jgi:hypothetical protein
MDKGGHFAAWEQPQLFSDPTYLFSAVALSLRSDLSRYAPEDEVRRSIAVINSLGAV